MPQVFVCGAVNLDIIMKTSRFPYPGETVIGGHVSYGQGGKGANQAVAAAQAGARTSFFGAVGTDEFGKRVAAHIGQRGVELHLAESVVFPTGVAVILIDDEGESSVVVDLGANQALAADAGQGSNIGPGDILLVQNEISREASIGFATNARRVGATSLFNASPFTAECLHDLSAYDYLIVNEIEFSQIMCKPPGSMTVENIESALGHETDIPVPNIIVTVGVRGVRARMGGEVLIMDGYSVTAVDTTGAGDCFCGSFAAALAAGISPVRCLAFSNAAAAISVQSMGAGPSMPGYGHIVAFLQEHS